MSHPGEQAHSDLYSTEVLELESSRFSYRDLRNLSRASTNSPLRVIALIDFDAFYAQCETVRLNLPRDQPLAVQQWQAIIALNYPAKALGLKRGMPVETIRSQYPETILQHVATWREGSSSWAYREDVNDHLTTDKAALDPYRIQSKKAFNLIKSNLPPSPLQCVEKASIDEVFCDLSKQVYSIMLEKYSELRLQEPQDAHDSDTRLPLPPISFLDWGDDKVVGADDFSQETEHADWDNIALHIGSNIVRGLRAEIYKQLRYTCSAGIARNKSLAKLAAGHNKPNQQTVIRSSSIHNFLSGYDFTKLRGLGGKLGQQLVTAFDTKGVAKLLKLTLQDLASKVGSDSARWVYNVIRGVDHSEVVERTALQSMLTAKTFVPRLTGLTQAEKWLRIFAGDLMGRLNEEDAASTSRRPRVIAFHHAINGRFGPTRSKQTTIALNTEINEQLLFSLSKDLLVQLCREGPSWPCLGLSVSVSDFVNLETDNRQLTSFFARNVVSQLAPRDGQNECDGQQSMEDRSKVASVKRKRSASATVDLHSLPSSSISLITEPTATVFKSRKDPSRTRDADTPDPHKDNHYNCPKCNKQVASADVLEHLDWHVAIELQHEDP